MTDDQSAIAVAHAKIFRLGDKEFFDAIRSIALKKGGKFVRFLKQLRRRVRWPLAYSHAERLAHSLSVTTAGDYRIARDGDFFYQRVLPAKPQNVYKATGWVSWPVYLGMYMPYDEALKTIRTHGVRSVSAYRNLVLAYSRAPHGHRLPYSPCQIYASQGFRGWSTFFGMVGPSMFVDYHHARMIVREYDLDTKDHYKECVETGSLSDMPLCPDEVYKDKGWTSWEDFLMG